MTVGRTIDYEALSQDAMRGVVRTILVDVAKNGLPGDHHFYVSFDTQAPGVLISKRLLEKYSDEMTIVLQHRFWDLMVTPELFEVKLTFDGIPERLVVPFTAIRVFFDPSVRYGLQFEAAGDDTAADGSSEAGGRSLIVQMGPDSQRGRTQARKPRTSRKSRIEKAETGDAVTAERGGATERPGPRAVPDASPARAPSAQVQPIKKLGRPALAQVPSGNGRSNQTAEGAPSRPTAATSEKAAADEPSKSATPGAAGAQVVSLDSFRKK